MTRGYIFDYGGTLDTNGDHWGKVLWHAYERCHMNLTEDMFRRAYVYGERTLATNKIIRPSFTFYDTLKTKIGLQLKWLDDNGQDVSVYSDIEKVLNEIYPRVCETTKESVMVLEKIADHYPLVLVSNFYGNINAVLHEFGFDNLFVEIVESSVVGIRKPNPEIFCLGVKKLGLPASEVVVVGDSYDKDILPAHSIGCGTVWIKGEGWTDEVVDNPIADRIIHRLSELL